MTEYLSIAAAATSGVIIGSVLVQVVKAMFASPAPKKNPDVPYNPAEIKVRMKYIGTDQDANGLFTTVPVRVDEGLVTNGIQVFEIAVLDKNVPAAVLADLEWMLRVGPVTVTGIIGGEFQLPRMISVIREEGQYFFRAYAPGRALRITTKITAMD